MRQWVCASGCQNWGTLFIGHLNAYAMVIPGHIWQKRAQRIKKSFFYKRVNQINYSWINYSYKRKRFEVFYVIFFLKKPYIFLSRSKRAACVCVTQQLTTSEGLALKPCNVSNCFPAIIPPSSLTQLPVTSADKGHTMEGYFLCRHTRTFSMYSRHMHTHTHQCGRTCRGTIQ